jgi:hypothetical protein
MDELIRSFLAASGGSLVGACLLYFLLRLFDEPLKSLLSVAASKEVEAFKNQLSESLESFKARLQRDLDVEPLNRSKRISFLEQQRPNSSGLFTSASNVMLSFGGKFSSARAPMRLGGPLLGQSTSTYSYQTTERWFCSLKGDSIWRAWTQILRNPCSST